MSRRPDPHGAPRAHVRAGGTWPSGPFEPDTPTAVRYAAAVAVRLRAELAARGISNTAAARGMGVSRQTLQRILGGQAMPDLRSLAAAETLLGVRLTPEPETLDTNGNAGAP